MTGKGNAVRYPLRAEVPRRQNAPERGLWNSVYSWNWVLLTSVLGCLLLWALVIWGILSVV